MTDVTDREEIYQMPSFPTLSVNDLPASTRWYQEALGFHHVFTIPGPTGEPLLVHADPVGFVLTFSQGPVNPGLGMDRIISRSMGREVI